MKRTLKLFGVLFAFVFACVGLASCELFPEVNEDESLSYVSMRINPEIELVVDEEGTVVSVNAINEDGQTVLCQIEVIGLTCEEAAEEFTSIAVELGYIDVDCEEAKVYILTDGINEEFVLELEAKVTDKVNEFFTQKGIYGKAVKEELEDFRDKAVEWAISEKEARIVDRILQLYPEMTEEEVLALTYEERINLIRDDAKNNGLTADLREEYKVAVEQIKAEYEQLFTLIKELKSLEIQLQNPELSEEQKAELQALYDAKKAECDALRDEYEAQVELVKNEKKGKCEEALEFFKNEASKRRNEFENKIKEHEDEIKDMLDDIMDKINNWRGEDKNN